MASPKHPIPVSPTAPSSSGGTLYLVFIQIVSRGLTFVGNQFLLRYLSPSLLGLAVQLETLSVTILYFARESLRVALQRRPSTAAVPSGAHYDEAKRSRAKSQEVVNLTYLALLVGLCVSLGFGYGYLQKSNHEVLSSTDFWLAFRLYATATFIELCAEPCFVVVQEHALFRLRARAETAAAISRCLAACATTVLMHQRHFKPSVLPFAVGQLFYAGALFTTYFVALLPFARARGFSLLPRKVTGDGPAPGSPQYWLDMFSKPIISLTMTFYAQSVFKLLLTQGDVLILSFLTDLKSQGAFALASNYGGLLSRLVFQPVEESSRNVFGRLLSSPSSSTDTKSAAYKKGFKQSLSHLSTTLHIYTLCALPILTLLPPVFPHLIRLALSTQWRTPETTSLLQAYIYYLPFLAINGVLDAFVTSVATPRQLRVQSLVMAGVTAAYAAFAWTLMASSPRAAAIRARDQPWASDGLVYAGIFNMTLRIAYSVWFVTGWIRTHAGDDDNNNNFTGQTWRHSLPRPRSLVTAAATAVALRTLIVPTQDRPVISRRLPGLPDLPVEHLAYLLTATAVLGTSMLLDERHFLADTVLPLLPARVRTTITRYTHISPTSDKNE